MIRKTVLVTGAAGLMLMAAPAFAQDAMSGQTPPAPPPAAAQTPAPAPAASGAVQLAPGADVKGGDGQVLGKLEGVRDNAGVQELTVRGADGQLRGVPLAGFKQDATGVSVAMTSASFMAAASITGPAPAPAAPPAPTPAPTAEPTAPAPADAMGPPAPTPPTTADDAADADPMTAQEPTEPTPTTPPTDPQA